LKKRILITGGAGFIGFHLARRLAGESSSRLTLVDDFSRGHRDHELEGVLSHGNVDLIDADLTRPNAWSSVGVGFDEVYHLAAVIGVKNVIDRPQEVIRVNALSTLHLLDWFVRGGGKKILFSSTSETYAWTQRFHELTFPTPEDVPLALTDLSDPRSSYAGSKIFGELAVTHYCRASEKRFTIVRYHNVYGPRMGVEHVIPELYARAVAGQNPLVVYSPHHRRAFCYVSDAVEATVAAMRATDADGGTFNVGNDQEETTIRSLAERIAERVEPRPTLEEADAPNDPISRRCPDLNKTRALLGYEPKVTLEQGLDLALAWYDARLRANAPQTAGAVQAS